MTKSRTALYRAQVAKLKERYAGKLDILCGLEWDLYSDDDPAAYDYFIGSVHYVQGPKTGRYYEIDSAKRTWPPASATILTATGWPWPRRTSAMSRRSSPASRRFWATLT